MPVEPVNAIVVFGQEHVPVRMENLLDQKLEIFLFDSSSVVSWLSNEGNLEGILEAAGCLGQFLQRIVQNVIPLDLNHQEKSVDNSRTIIFVLRHNAVHHGYESFLHIDLVFHSGFDFEQFLDSAILYVLVVDIEQEGVLDEVEDLDSLQTKLKLVCRIEELHHIFAVETIE